MLPDKFYKEIVELSPFPVYVTTGADMIITVANDATLRAWGRDKSVIGKRFEDALPELKDQPFKRLIEHVYSTGESYSTDIDRADLIVDNRLQTYYYKFTYQPMVDEHGKINSVLCFASNVTELEHARQAIEQSRLTLYNMIRQAPVGICIISASDLIVEAVNDAYLELVGKERIEIENKPIWEGVPEAEASYRPIMDSVIQDRQAFLAKEHEVLLIRNGIEEKLFIDFVYEPVVDLNQVVSSIMVVVIDVTDKVQARKAIEESEERARLAVEAADIGTFDIDQLSGNVRTSDRFNRIFGFEENHTWGDYVELLHPDDRELRNEAHKVAAATGKLYYEARIVIPEGTVRWVRVQARTYLTEDKEPHRILGTVLDITEYKRLQQQKDDFISVASHELKTPMTSIKASMQVLDRLIKADPSSEKVPQFMEKVNSNLAKMHQLVESLLNVSKITSGQLELQKSRFKISELIGESCDHVRITDEFEILTTGDLDAEIFADRYKIDQVVVNLVNNAIKYAPDSKTILVEIQRLENNLVNVAVIDKGPGIPSSKLSHLFDRYYRVDSTGLQYSGLGLGLYICAEIISRHGGKIGVDSVEGEGSKFWFQL